MAGWLLWVIVACVLLFALVTVRPLLRARRRRRRPVARTGPAALIGKQATVVERIVNSEGVGLVRIGGDVWTARAIHDGEEIEAGTRVEVIEIRGATALVAE
jgi:membrane protein implicated in regulation of membrane protease activity